MENASEANKLVIHEVCYQSVDGECKYAGPFEIDISQKNEKEGNANYVSVETESDFVLSINNATSTGAELELLRTKPIPGAKVSTGQEYAIEKYVNNSWEACEYVDKNDEIAWFLVAYGIPYKETIDWEGLYGELSAGKYRLSKGITIDRNAGYETRIIYGEFEIN